MFSIWIDYPFEFISNALARRNVGIMWILDEAQSLALIQR